MALSITVSITGSPNELDVRAAKLIVSRKNEQLASQEPPGTPLAITPLAALSASYQSVLAETITAAHSSYVQQANEAYVTNADRAAAFKNATDAVRSQIDGLLGL